VATNEMRNTNKHKQPALQTTQTGGTKITLTEICILWNHKYKNEWIFTSCLEHVQQVWKMFRWFRRCNIANGGNM